MRLFHDEIYKQKIAAIDKNNITLKASKAGILYASNVTKIKTKLTIFAMYIVCSFYGKQSSSKQPSNKVMCNTNRDNQPFKLLVGTKTRVPAEVEQGDTVETRR